MYIISSIHQKPDHVLLLTHMSTHEHEAKHNQPAVSIISTPVAIIIGSIVIALGIFGGLAMSGGSPSGTAGSKWEKAATAVNINKKKFEQCIDSGKYTERVASDLASGQAAGVTGTPSSFIIGANGTQYRINGAQSAETVKALIESALAGKASTDAQVTLPPLDAKDHVLGDTNAPITIIEYSDLECPFCIRFHTVQETIMKEYAGKVKWVHRHFPLDFHANAKPYAYAAECAAEIGGNDAFWKMIDYIFKNQPLKI